MYLKTYGEEVEQAYSTQKPDHIILSPNYSSVYLVATPVVYYHKLVELSKVSMHLPTD